MITLPSPHGWKAWDRINVAALPTCAGLYAVYLDGSLAYIGSSRSLKKRICSHSLPHASCIGWWKGRRFSSYELHFSAFPDGDERWKGLEVSLIEAFTPPLNARVQASGVDLSEDYFDGLGMSGMHLEYG